MFINVKDNIRRNKMKEYTEEERRCCDSLKNKGEWTCFGNDIKAIKHFVENVMGPDYKFECHSIKTAFGQMVSVRKK